MRFTFNEADTPHIADAFAPFGKRTQDAFADDKIIAREGFSNAWINQMCAEHSCAYAIEQMFLTAIPEKINSTPILFPIPSILYAQLHRECIKAESYCEAHGLRHREIIIEVLHDFIHDIHELVDEKGYRAITIQARTLRTFLISLRAVAHTIKMIDLEVTD